MLRPTQAYIYRTSVIFFSEFKETDLPLQLEVSSEIGPTSFKLGSNINLTLSTLTSANGWIITPTTENRNKISFTSELITLKSSKWFSVLELRIGTTTYYLKICLHVINIFRKFGMTCNISMILYTYRLNYDIFAVDIFVCIFEFKLQTPAD